MGVEWMSSFLAGSVAGASSVLVGHPFDSLKTRMQVDRQLESTKITFSTLRTLYRGILPPLLTVGLVQSVNFSMYETFKRKLLRENRKRGEMTQKTYLTKTYLSGACAGAILSLLTTPIGVVKVQQQVASELGLLKCAQFIHRKFGWTVFYRGAFAGLLMEGFGRGVYITTYETVKLLLVDEETKRATLYGEPVATSVKTKMIAAACAGTCGWLSVYPIDVVKSRMMLDCAGEEFKTTRECFWKTFQQGGVKRLYRGLGFSLIRASPVAATVLPMYEVTKRFLDQYI